MAVTGGGIGAVHRDLAGEAKAGLWLRLPEFVVMGAWPFVQQGRLSRESRSENATLLGDAVLAHGPVLIGEAG